MNVEIVPVRNKRLLKEFIRLPWKIYSADTNWVPPLIMDMKNMLNKNKHPFFQHSDAEFFLAKKNATFVGRIAAILNNNHNQYHNEHTGFFGFFESIDDEEVSNALLGVAQAWVKERGMKVLRGPTNYSTNETCGLLSDGFDSSPVLMMPYNPGYYIPLMEKFGLKPAKKLFAYYFDRDMPIPERYAALARRTLADPSIHFRTANLKKVWHEVEEIKTIYNDAWSDNWGFVPMTEAELRHMAKELKPIADADIIYFAEAQNEIAGFSLALPDYNQILKEVNGRLFPFGLIKLLLHRKRINRIRVITLGVRKKFQKKRGLAPTFYYETYTRGKKKGYALAEFSWILEDNVLMNRALEGLGAKLYKTYLIYEKEI